MEVIILILLVLLIILYLIFNINKIELKNRDIKSKRIAGEIGENKVASIISQMIDKNDVLLRNVSVTYEGKETELDNVIISKRGLFIIEVKNYNGELEGDEESYEWKKYKSTRDGKVYSKKVRNPIKQVKRQIYILGNYLRYYGIDIWINGYVYLLNSNSPVYSDYVLDNINEMDKVLHKKSERYLNKDTINKIIELLQ